MSGVKLTNIRIAHAQLRNCIVLARFGKDPKLALEIIDAESDFFNTLVSYAFDGRMPDAGEAVEVQFGGGDEQFTVTVRRQALGGSNDTSE